LSVNNNISEKELILKCIEGDRFHQEILYRKFADKMFSVSKSYCDNETDACDILQTGFIKVFQNLNKFKFEGSFEGWIRRIIVNTAFEHFRKKKRRKEVFYESEVLKAPIEIAENFLDQIKSSEVIELVNKLPERAALVLKLYAVEGYSHKEIASQMEISVGTSKSQLSRARILLKEIVDKRGGR